MALLMRRLASSSTHTIAAAAATTTTTNKLALSSSLLAPHSHSHLFLSSSSPCLLTSSLSVSSPRSFASKSSAGGRGEKSTTITAYGSRPRVDSAQIAGELAEPSSQTSKSEFMPGLTLTKQVRSALLNPIQLSRGGSAKSAKQHRELHDPNTNRLNHSLAHYITRATNWKELVELCYEHMHHMSVHNLLKSMHKLVKLASTRELLDNDCYNKFGRYMVQVETRLVDLDQAGLMKQGFLPYHYLRQCLKQMYLAQERARAELVADPVRAGYQRRSKMLEDEAAQEYRAETEAIAERMRYEERLQTSKYDFGRNDEKTAKTRTKERRAGRAFVSIAQTQREAEAKPRSRR